jgi:hypothetical protein
VAFGYRNPMAPQGAYEIVRLMPSETGEPQYRIRSLHEAHERMEWEHELRRIARNKRPTPKEGDHAVARSPLPDSSRALRRLFNDALSRPGSHCQYHLMSPPSASTLRKMGMP